jgi:kynurenine formamidase
MRGQPLPIPGSNAWWRRRCSVDPSTFASCYRKTSKSSSIRSRPKKVALLPQNYAITAEDLEGCARAASADVRSGDVLLVRTGYATCWNDPATYLNAAGVSKSANLWAAERGVVAVGADNMAWDAMTERDPDTNMTLFGHVHLLVTHGIHILENLNLEALAAEGHREFAFIGIPLKLQGATGSPIRPLALVE